MRNTPINFLIAFLLVAGISPAAFAQVPDHQDRIRETTRSILNQPEFRWFPRLDARREARTISQLQSGGSQRVNSSRGIPGGVNQPAPEEAGGELGGNRRNLPRGPNGLPPDAPGGNDPAGNKLPDANEALGREDEFPEAGGKLNPLPEKMELPENAENPANPEEPKEQQLDNPPKNDEIPERNPLAKPGENPPLVGPGPNRPQEKPPEGQAEQILNPRLRGSTKPLPAPKPRERSDAENPSWSIPEAKAGVFAQIVGAVFHGIAWTILAVICGLIVWLVIKAIRDYERPLAFSFADGKSSGIIDLEPAQAPGDLPADVYLAHAQQLADAGRYREAVVQLMLGAMSRMERAGWVRFRRGMTVRDYLDSVQAHPAAYQGLRTLIRIFEPITFGRREPTKNHFDQSLQGYETGFGRD